SRGAIELAEVYDFIYATVGMHAHDASRLDEAASKEIEEMADHEKVVAVGEIGLDYCRDLSPRDVQREAFREQLELAMSVNLPVVIHVRKAYEDALKILKEWYHGCGVMHCFSGSADQARMFLELGFKLGFTGSITFGNTRLESIARLTPKADILIETDCPFLVPRPKKGRNEPAYLRIICEKVAAVTGMSHGDTAAMTRSNAMSLFRI
ncbi:MAG: TatD family hydrolase, partial [bacterium]